MFAFSYFLSSIWNVIAILYLKQKGFKIKNQVKTAYEKATTISFKGYTFHFKRSYS